MWIYNTVAGINEINLATEVVAILNKTLKLRDKPLAPSLFEQRRTPLRKQGFEILECFANRKQALLTVRHALNYPVSS